MGAGRAGGAGGTSASGTATVGGAALANLALTGSGAITGAPTFTVTATASGQAVTATGLIADSVTSVGNDSTGAMDLTLSSGTVVPYSTVQQLY